jgi:hypothetical protein
MIGGSAGCRIITNKATSTIRRWSPQQRVSCCELYQRASFFTGVSPNTTIANELLKQVAQEQPLVLAQMNYARLVAPMDEPRMKEFQLALEPVNILAKTSPGFVWSYDNDDEAEHMAVDLLREDPLLMPQLSLWKDMASLRHFVFKSGHGMYFKRKKEWFTAPPSPYSVCWWHDLTANEFRPPSLKESFERCSYLQEFGPTEHAFDFASADQKFPMPSKT